MAASEQVWFCYMVRCVDSSYYVGIAVDVVERVRKHNWGVGPEYTAKRRPVELVWSERCGSSAVARKREKEIKSWSRTKKETLVKRTEVHPSPASLVRGKGESSNG